ncbi:hypothetical protein NLU13_7930 [Sarocladium strictum]|uniref:AB hydrolase-1 domain-containing protein n=1 Tax=Sarocladium strictum TaxID=5046 RepID=A0AA39GEE8_SARSR|nr:hypothetical protein NLU13_7930 [Sarocladium strictum]
MSTQQTARTQHVTSPSGAQYAYRRLGTGLGVPLVLLTHFRGVMDRWDPLFVNGLAAHRRIITVDYLGVGLSGGEVATSVRQSAADIEQFLELIDEHEIDLLGFSLGGYVAQMVALNAQPVNGRPRVRRLVLAGTGTSYGEKLSQSPNEDVGAVAGSKHVTLDVFKTLFFPNNREGDAAAEDWWARIHERSPSSISNTTADEPEEVSEWLSQDFTDQGKGLLAQVSQGRQFTGQASTSLGIDGAYDRLKDLQIPVLVANGSNDYMIPTANSFLIQQMVPKGQLLVYPNSGHGFLFQHATAFVKHVLSFLEN